MSAPVGWTVLKQEPEQEVSGPSSDDLMAIADAVREVGSRNAPAVIQESPLSKVVPQEIGRRGHLRAIPNA
jgi:hypothetical protein